MPLILAIEPDRRQAAHLTSVVRRRVGAELILVDTTERALDAIGSQVPDLVLVPALLSPHDDAALATALRVIAAAAHVQMLTIPVLGAPRPSERSAGVLAGLRRDRSRSAEPEGCDPTVFAEQIASYLEHAAQERADLLADSAPDDVARDDDALETDVPATAPLDESAAPVDAEIARVESPAPGPVDDSVWTAVEEAVRAQFLAPTPAPESPSPLPSPPAIEAIEASDAGDRTPPNAVDESIWIAVEEAVRAQFLAVTPAPVEPAAPAVRGEEWVELIESLRHDVERLRTERAKPAPKASPSPRVPRSSRPTRPAENEWGFFDPEQCGFAALLAKLEEVTESDETLRT